MTIGYMIDNTFIEALFNEDHQYHKHALSLINVLDQNQLYITTIELIKVIDLCKNLDKETKMEMFRLVTEITKSAECS